MSSHSDVCLQTTVIALTLLTWLALRVNILYMHLLPSCLQPATRSIMFVNRGRCAAQWDIRLGQGSLSLALRRVRLADLLSLMAWLIIHVCRDSQTSSIDDAMCACVTFPCNRCGYSRSALSYLISIGIRRHLCVGALDISFASVSGNTHDTFSLTVTRSCRKIGNTTA